MAAQKTDKVKAPKKGGGGMMGMLSKVFALLAAVLATLFFAAVFDVEMHAGKLEAG